MDNAKPVQGQRLIVTVQDETNAMAVMYMGSRIRFRSIHKWDRSKRYIDVTLDREVIRELAKELWRAAGQCDYIAKTDGITRHAEGLIPLDEETWEFDTEAGIPPEYLWKEKDK